MLLAGFDFPVTERGGDHLTGGAAHQNAGDLQGLIYRVQAAALRAFGAPHRSVKQILKSGRLHRLTRSEYSPLSSAHLAQALLRNSRVAPVSVARC